MNDNQTKPTRFSVPDIIKEIGQEVWCYDTSFSHDLNGNFLPPADEAYIKKSLVEHIPMTVHTYPVLRKFQDPFSNMMDEEYFIAVTIPGICYQFYILNSKSGLLDSYVEMMEFIGPEY